MNSLLQNKKVLVGLVVGVALIFLGVAGYFAWQYVPILTSPFNQKANPLKVTVVAGEKQAVKLVDAAGGTVELAGDATKAVLSVPKEGVSQSENLSLKEIKSIDGMGQGAKLVAGVQAAPDGTTFLGASDLTFETAGTGKLIGFAFDGDGNNFHLYPLTRDGNKVTMKITHFSGYGVIDVGDGSYTPPTPQSIKAKAQQLIAKIILEGQKESGGLNENQKQRIYNLMNAWWKTAVKPDLEKSVGNDDLVIPAFDHYLVWLAGAQGLGLDSRFATEQEYAMDTAAKATKNAYEKASKKCSEQKDPTQIAKMSKLAKFAMKWGLNHKQGLNVDDLLEKTKKCAVFELRVNSTTSFPKYNQSITASGSANITMDSNYNLVGEGIINQTAYSNEGFVCSYTSGGMPKFPFKIVSTKLDVSSQETKTSLILEFDDVENTLVCHSANPEVDFTSTDHGDDWLTDYFIIHHGEDYQDPGLFTISDWQIVNTGGVYAKKAVDRDKFIDNGHPELNYTLHENTTYELIHKPR